MMEHNKTFDASVSDSGVVSSALPRTGMQRLAWLPICFLLAAMVVLWGADVRGSYGSNALIMSLNFIFSTLASGLIVYLVSRSFLTRGEPGLLMLGCGVLAWGAAGVLAKAVNQGDANLDVTIHNSCVWLSALFHLTSALLLLRPRRAVQAREMWLGVAYAGALGVMGLFVVAALHGYTPTFFVQGTGGTSIRQFVLGSAIVMFLSTVVLLTVAHRRLLPVFLYWYSLALSLIAIGLLGIMIESVYASLLSWTGLTAQYLSGVYMLIAAIASVRESGAWHMSLEAALRESEERLALAASATQIGMFDWNISRGTVLWTQAHEAIFGYAPATTTTTTTPTTTTTTEHHYRRWADRVHPDDLLFVEEESRRCMQERKPLEVQYRIIWPDGSHHWVETRGVFQFDSDGKANRVLGVVMDVTKRKRTEEALQESERRERERADELATVLDAVPTPVIIVHDPESLHMTGNIAADELLRHPRGAEISLSAPTEVKPGHFRAFKDGRELMLGELPAQRAARGTCVKDFEFNIVFDDGITRHLLGYGTPLLNDEGRPRGAVHVLVDITERKQAEAALMQSEERYRTLFETMTDGFSLDEIILDDTGNPVDLCYLSVNPAFERHTGLRAEDVVGRTIRDLFPESEPVWFERYGKVALTGEPVHFEERFGPLNKWFKVSAFQTEPGRFAVVFNDITARRQAEEALRQQTEEALLLSEQEFHSLAEAMPQIVWATRPDGWNIYFNQQWMDYTGLTMEESYGHGWNTPFHPDDKQRAWDAWQRATKDNERYSLECRLRRADGVYRWWLVRGEPMRGANGEILKWFGTCTDIEELKCAEAVLLESNDLLEQRVTERTLELLDSKQQFIVLIQNLQSAVALINDRGEFSIVNRSFLRMFELDDHATIKNVNDCDWSQWQVFEEDGSLLDVDEHPVRKAALTGRPVRDKLVAMKAHESPELKWLLVSTEAILDAQGHVYRLICTYHDITARKQAEDDLKKLNDDLENMVTQRTAELREKDQMLMMQSRQAAMGEMIGNISHQWRQPLNILGMQLQQLQLFYDLGQFNEELLGKNVARSMEIIKHMSKTIDDFRNYFKPDKEKTEFNVHESIKTSLSLLEGSLKNPLIDVAVVANDDPTIYGFPNEFAQVILNIMNNARDVFIERNVSGSKVHIEIFSESKNAVVTIADNAGGIPEDIINKVFDPYFTTKGPQQGTGVGLFMSKAIIEKNMGGRLTVRNIADGAEFRIEV